MAGMQNTQEHFSARRLSSGAKKIPGLKRDRGFSRLDA
tara:strand:+ start:1115 stop:1228 length:114 start_codon:yes stop_codon:yes gene_type:complete